jgi:hypothetical protein
VVQWRSINIFVPNRGCSRPDPDVRQAARMPMPARGAYGELLPGTTAGRQAEPVSTFLRPARCAVRGGPATAGRERPFARRARFAPPVPPIRGGHAYRPTKAYGGGSCLQRSGPSLAEDKAMYVAAAWRNPIGKCGRYSPSLAGAGEGLLIMI